MLLMSSAAEARMTECSFIVYVLLFPPRSRDPAIAVRHERAADEQRSGALHGLGGTHLNYRRTQRSSVARSTRPGGANSYVLNWSNSWPMCLPAREFA